jgi:predicted glycosyltransferase
MKIWFDISNSPQVLLFKDMLIDLKSQGHDLLITSRPLANTVALLDEASISHTIIGKHYGRKTFKKLLGYPIRVYHLWIYLRNKQIDLSISQSSFHAPLVARLLGVPSIYTNDNEHAIGNLPAFIFASSVLLPDKFSINNSILKSILNRKTIYYPGVKEGIYLFRKAGYRQYANRLSSRPPFNIYIRPEPSTAQYYKGKQNFLDDLIKSLKSEFSITILPRNEEQKTYYTSATFNGVYIPPSILSFDEIVKDCSLFIGAGGSMTREMALMGIPTISVYQDKLLSVDMELIKQGQMVYKPDLKVEDVRELALNKNQHNTSFLENGRLAYDLFMKTINNYNYSL